MRTRPLAPLLGFLLALGACAIGPDRATVLNAMIGRPETEIIRTYGVPARTYESGGHKFLAYTEQRAEYIAPNPFFGAGFYGSGFYGGGLGLGYATGFPAEIIARQCETTFDIANGQVLTWALRGNACG